jgi:tryptophanyl-tRNA synthetase
MFVEYFRPFAKKREELLKERGYVESILAEGAEKAASVASDTMKQVKEAVGLI